MKKYADVAKLADALDLGSSVFDVGVQVLSSAPKRVFVELFISVDISEFEENKKSVLYHL